MSRPSWITPPPEEGLELFESMRQAGPPIAAARETDPATSHAAAASAPVNEHQAKILDALAAGPAGASGVAARAGLTGVQVNRRINELVASGHLVETGRLVKSAAGRAEREWRRV